MKFHCTPSMLRCKHIKLIFLKGKRYGFFISVQLVFGRTPPLLSLYRYYVYYAYYACTMPTMPVLCLLCLFITTPNFLPRSLIGNSFLLYDHLWSRPWVVAGSWGSRQALVPRSGRVTTTKSLMRPKIQPSKHTF